MKTRKNPDQDVVTLSYGYDLPANTVFRFDGVYKGFKFQLVETTATHYMKCNDCAFGVRRGGVCCSLIRCNAPERKDRTSVIVVVKP